MKNKALVLAAHPSATLSQKAGNLYSVYANKELLSTASTPQGAWKVAATNTELGDTVRRPRS